MGRRQCPRRLVGLIGFMALAGLAAPACAAELTFDIPAQPRQGALLAFARAANLSLGFAPGAHCAGRAGVRGRMPAAEALARLLDGSACVAVWPDARTVVIRRGAPRSRWAAPPAPPVPPTVLGELVVTADKTETLLSSAPYGITAASGPDLQRQGVADVADLSLIASGVTVTNLGPGRNKVLLRGLSDGPLTGHTQSTVGLYLDDLRLTYNAPDPDLPLIDMARVEVLRGPQGSLYGAGSIGGVLQLVPNAPDPSARSGRLSVGLGATAHGSASGRAEGVVNQPFGPRAAVRIAAWSQTDGGAIDNPRLGARDIDRSRRRGVRLAGAWRPADDLSLEATFVDQTIANRDSHYATPAVGTRAHATGVSEPHDNDFLALALAAHWRPEWGHLTLSLGALDHDVGTTYDAASAPPALVAGGGPAATFKDRNEIRGLVSEARISVGGPGRWRWTLGAFNALGDQRLDATLTPAGAGAGYAEVRRDRLLESAVFGEISYDVTPTVTLTAGGRIFHARLKARSDVSAGAAERLFSGRTSDSGFAPKMLLAYRPAPRLTVYALAAEGYRTPGFNTGGPPGQRFAGADDGQPARRYAGDELWSYEAGGRWRSEKLGLTLRAAVFQADWTDIQADLLLPSGLPYTANLGDGRSRGVEVEASYRIGSLTLSGNVVRQDPELRRKAAGLAGLSEAGLPGIADTSYAGAAFWTTPLGNDHALDLSASYAYVGRSRLRFDAATAPVMGGYGDLRLAATVHGDAWGLRLAADNALDGHGDTLAFGNPFAFRLERQTTPQRPRTLTVSFTRDF